MMVIWSGWGLLTVVIAVTCMGFSGLPAETLGIPFNVCFAGSLILAALLNFLVARWRDGQPTRALVDAATGERFELRDRSSLFFVPLRYWTYLLVAFAALALALLPAKQPPYKGMKTRAALQSTRA